MNEQRSSPKLDSSYDVVVIGAGNGGLGAALKLALAGARPLLLEQHNVPGGFATSFVRGRFEFEASLHEMADVGSAENKGSLRKFLDDEAGLDLGWVAVPEAYRVIVTDEDIDAVMPFGIENYVNAVEKAVPGSGPGTAEYLSLCKDVSDSLGYLSLFQKRPDELFRDITDYLKKTQKPFGPVTDAARKLSNFFKTAACNVEEVTETFDLPSKAKQILYPYGCYLGPPMSRLSFTLWAGMLINYLTYGAYVLRMRSQEMTAAMESRIRELGGQVEFNTRVEKILVENGRVTGVETAAGDRIRTSHVISNASPTLVYNKLIHPRDQVPETAYKNVNARIHGAAGFVVFLGLDAPPEELGITEYGYFISNKMDTDAIYKSMGQLGLVNMQASTCLNLAVPDCSPPGTTILSLVTMYTPDVWENIQPKDYFKLKNRIAGDMIRQFEQGARINIRDHIEEIEVATPVTFARYTGTFKGSIYGYEPDPWDSVIPRILALKDETYVHGLEFAGGYAWMCHGYNSAILSGVTAAQTTLGKMGVSHGA